MNIFQERLEHTHSTPTLQLPVSYYPKYNRYLGVTESDTCSLWHNYSFNFYNLWVNETKHKPRKQSFLLRQNTITQYSLLAQQRILP